LQPEQEAQQSAEEQHFVRAADAMPATPKVMTAISSMTFNFLHWFSPFRKRTAHFEGRQIKQAAACWLRQRNRNRSDRRPAARCEQGAHRRSGWIAEVRREEGSPRTTG